VFTLLRSALLLIAIVNMYLINDGIFLNFTFRCKLICVLRIDQLIADFYVRSCGMSCYVQ
jgi:hypothetical protein